ncbi:MAG: ABC transporter ATP-binding protein, partial [Lachnospiraceae bacterium]|nr:ABC transporter ATP-binding protein [Lachnospiraceae bacterium]
VDENIVLPHLLDGRDMDYERLDSIVDYLGLTDRRRNLPSQLSGGQQQRVSIGRAIYTHPAILLADEPTGNLDRKNGEDIIRFLKDSNRRYKQTLILITHDESIALQADRMLYIEDGRIVRDERIHGGVQGAVQGADEMSVDRILEVKKDIKDKTSLHNNGDNADVYGGGTDEE